MSAEDDRAAREEQARAKAAEREAALAATADPVGDNQASAADQLTGLNGGPPAPEPTPLGQGAAGAQPAAEPTTTQLPDGRWVVELDTVQAVTKNLEGQMRSQAILLGVAMGIALLALVAAAKASRAATGAAAGTIGGAAS